MAPIGLAAAGPEAIVGRLAAGSPDAGSALVLDRPVQMKKDGQDFAIAVDAKGVSRRGRPADVKGVHWIMTKAPQGGFVLRRVGGWYEFEKPSAAPTTLLVGRPQAKEVETAGHSAVKKLPQSTPLPSAEAELKIEANKRKEWADRWEKMQGRREGRLGVRVKFGDIIKTKTDVKPEGPKRKVEHPEEERVNDETGISKQKKKKAKQLRKEANAVDQAEEDDVPETANALLKLKHERGEAGWDFSDEEAFSDDEQEKEQFEGGAIAGTEEVDEAAPSGDEDEGEDAEQGDLLTSHGKQLEVLIQNFNEEEDDKGEGAGDLSGEEDAPEDEEAPDNEVTAKAEVVESKRRRVTQEQQEASSPPATSLEVSSASATPASRAPAASLAPTAAAAPKASAQPHASAASAAPPAMAAGQNASSTPALAPSASASVSSSAAPATSQATVGPDSAYAKLRQETIQCLRQQGGSCTLKQLTAVMNLKNTKSERYKNVTVILKEVAALKMDPSTKKAVLKLLPEHRQ
mmetsp:Transcript_148082/g.261092  ORF Transcript_148082/g.261092 Transcript_148082/m.261092 type:complete len:518 (+) Transcript_148082:70-1623(+)